MLDVDTILNVVLLALGAAGTLAAFGGETWVGGTLPLRRRVTRRGWLSLLFMFSALCVGIVKEVRSSQSSEAAARANSKLQVELAEAKENYLAAQKAHKDTTLELERANGELSLTTDQLRDTRRKLASIEPSILTSLITVTEGIRRESDFATPSLRGEPEIEIQSGRNPRTPLILYGGDFLDYHVFCRTNKTIRQPFGDSSHLNEPRLSLEVGETSYRLHDQGRQMIIGGIGTPMFARLMNPDRIRECQLKILVESADRSRIRDQIRPIMELIESAKRDIQ